MLMVSFQSLNHLLGGSEHVHVCNQRARYRAYRYQQQIFGQLSVPESLFTMLGTKPTDIQPY